MSKISIIRIISLLLLSSIIFTAPIEDKVTSMPSDFPYDITKHAIYSGYLSIAHSPTKKLHYVYVESENDPVNDPILLWYGGGPGCSSLLAFGDENGPIYFGEIDLNIYYNDYSWNKLANVLYIEQPAGVGFSIAETEDDFYTNDEITAKDNLASMEYFYSKFPELIKNELYVTGESYAGIYVPYLAEAIIDYNVTAKNKINLKGILVGNGATDWSVDITPALIEFAYQHALISYEDKKLYDDTCIDSKSESESEACYNVVHNIKAHSLAGINIYDIYNKCYLPRDIKRMMNSNINNSNNDMLNEYLSIHDYEQFNYTPFIEMHFNNKYKRNLSSIEMNNNEIDNDEDENEDIDKRMLRKRKTIETPFCVDSIGNVAFFNRSDVKRGLNVDVNIKYKMCNIKFRATYSINWELGSYHIYPKLFENNLRVWAFSGDTDAAVPTNGTRAWIHKLGRNVIKSYRSWRVDGNKEEIAGYVEDLDGISFVTVKGTGHFAPQTKRKEVFHLLKKYLEGESL